MNNAFSPNSVKPKGLSEMIARCHLLWKRYCARACLPYGLSLKQLYVLRLLEQKARSPLDIARALLNDKPTTSLIIRNLEKRGWVQRAADKHDKRRVILTLTQAGQEKGSDIRKYEEAIGKAHPFSCLTREEKQLLHDLLEKVHANLERIADGEHHEP